MKKLAIIAIMTAFGATALACGDSKPAQNPSDMSGGDAGSSSTTTTTTTTGGGDTTSTGADGGK